MSIKSNKEGFRIGGAERDRTVDLLNAIQALSQLSYGPTLRMLHPPKWRNRSKNFERVRYHRSKRPWKMVTNGNGFKTGLARALKPPCLRGKSLLISGLNFGFNFASLTSSPERLIRGHSRSALLSLTIPRDG